MIQIDIFSGFLGAGKTTLIKKLIREAYAGERVVLIENEFGEIGVDGGFMQDAGIEVTEMNSGCICCSLVGDFSKALQEVANRYSPDRILIEPSGVGKLSDVIKAVQRAEVKDSRLNAFCTVVDAKKCKAYLKNFGEFFLDQVENASCIVLSHTAGAGEKTEQAASLLKEHTNATIITTDWEKLSGKDILLAMQRADHLQAELENMMQEEKREHCHHHDHDGHEHCCHNDQEEHEHCHYHDHEEHGHCHHHDHDEHENCCRHVHDEHEHCHHHDHDEHEHCCRHDHDEHDHHHDHHGHHHADEVFTSWGVETAKRFTQEELKRTLARLDSGEFGTVLRAKGIVDGGESWIHFDYVPEEADVRTGSAAVTGRLCVIGCRLNEEALKILFLK